MKTELALRHLLLRHLEPLEESAPRDTFREVTGSLSVEASRSGYTVRWQRDGATHERVIPRGEYTFYARGDRHPETRTGAEDLRNRNDERARALAREILGASAAAPRVPARPREPFRALGMAGAVGVGLALLAAGAGTVTALGVALLILVEYAPRGRLAASALLVALAAGGAATATLLGSLAYGALQILDPDTRERRLRTALCVLAVAVAATRIGPEAGEQLGPGAVAIGAAGLAVAALRSVLGSHARGLPLALPFFFVGLYLDGRTAAGWVGLGCAALGVLGAAQAHRWLRVQQQHPLTPDV